MCFAMLIMAMTVQAQKEIYTLSDWNLKDWDAQKGELSLDVDGETATLTYPGKALRHNASLWNIGHGYPGGFPNSLQVRKGAIRHLEISGKPLPRVDGQNPLFTDTFTADPAFTVVGNTVYAYVGEDKAGVGGWFNMPGWLCYSSTDMIHWKAHGTVLRPDAFYSFYSITVILISMSSIGRSPRAVAVC